MRRVLIAVLAAAAFMTGLIGLTGHAAAMQDPFPTCIRECSPLPDLPQLPGGPCHPLVDGPFC